MPGATYRWSLYPIATAGSAEPRNGLGRCSGLSAVQSEYLGVDLIPFAATRFNAGSSSVMVSTTQGFSSPGVVR